MYHLHSVEKLHHFNCPRCNQWWTIGDWEKQETITCPTCKITLETISLEDNK